MTSRFEHESTVGKLGSVGIGLAAGYLLATRLARYDVARATPWAVVALAVLIGWSTAASP